MSNPLLSNFELPAFSSIKPEHIEPAIDQLLSKNRQQIEELLDNAEHPTWDNLMQPIEAMEDELHKAWSPVRHMNSVVNNEPLRKAFNACLPKLTEFHAEKFLNDRLYQAVKKISESEEQASFNQAQKKIIENTLRDFCLSGVELPEDKRERFKEIEKQLSSMSAKFEENVLDATKAWTHLITKKKEIKGLPEHAIAEAKQAAEAKNENGWLINLEFPTYFAVITYADNRDLRETIYKAFNTRASDHFPAGNKWDNTQLMHDMVLLHQEQATLLGFANYSEYSLATKMAENTNAVLKFLYDLLERARPKAENEMQRLRAFAQNEYGVDHLEAWDVPYYSEKLMQHQYAISQEELRAYFPEDKVLSGMFTLMNKLYGLIIKEEQVDTWHPDVRFFNVFDEAGEKRAQFYLDLYARTNKRGGAWMDECVNRRIHNNKVQIPVTYLTCNFTKPQGDQPALFTHEEVLTLFHEFGHGLQHMLTKIDYMDVSGINGVPWDAVEFPSQFNENWCWQKEFLPLISEHIDTKQPLPEDIIEKLLAAKNFHAAMRLARQLEFSLFDFIVHMEIKPDVDMTIQQILDNVRVQTSIVPVPAWHRFQNSFTHVFGGEYAAGYYSYKWAEVLSSDAFAKFEEDGVTNWDTGRAFMHTILEQGGARDPMELFQDFRGRKPKIDALLRHSGLSD